MKFDEVRDYLSDEVILFELIQYLSADELNRFTESLIADYDLDWEE